MMKYKKCCVICKKEFLTKKNTQKLCSLKCRGIYESKPFIKIICFNCGKQFKVKYKNRKQKFCSLNCSTSYNNKNNKDYKYFKGINNPSKREDVKKAISQKLKGRDAYWMKGLRNPNYGGLKPETKEKIRLKHIGLLAKEKHPNWKGGITNIDYGGEWTKELKTLIRKRDNFVCRICNKNGFSVHHIDYNKKNNSINNLITLCRSCHIKTNYHRNSWIIFFKSLEIENGKD